MFLMAVFGGVVVKCAVFLYVTRYKAFSFRLSVSWFGVRRDVVIGGEVGSSRHDHHGGHQDADKRRQCGWQSLTPRKWNVSSLSMTVDGVESFVRHARCESTFCQHLFSQVSFVCVWMRLAFIHGLVAVAVPWIMYFYRVVRA